MLVLAYPIAFIATGRWPGSVCPVRMPPVTSPRRWKSISENGWRGHHAPLLLRHLPALWIYGVTITNTFMTFWENQLQMPALNRGFVALFLLLLMAFVIWFGKDLMVKVMSFPVFPFIASLVLISCR